MKQPLIKLRASEAVLAEAQQMAHAGNWHIDMLAKSYVCSAEAYPIFGVDPTVWIKTRREGVYLGGMPAGGGCLYAKKEQQAHSEEDCPPFT